MLRVSGYLLIAISVIHVLVGIWLFTEPLTDILQNGVFNAVAPDPFAPYFDREAAFWFMIASPLFFTLGQLCCWAQERGIALPTFLGWNLLAISMVGVVLEPISGFWLLMLPAFLIIIGSRQLAINPPNPNENSSL